jgi:hypothetical protein
LLSGGKAGEEGDIFSKLPLRAAGQARTTPGIALEAPELSAPEAEAQRIEVLAQLADRRSQGCELRAEIVEALLCRAREFMGFSSFFCGHSPVVNLVTVWEVSIDRRVRPFEIGRRWGGIERADEWTAPPLLFLTRCAAKAPRERFLH